MQRDVIDRLVWVLVPDITACDKLEFVSARLPDESMEPPLVSPSSLRRDWMCSAASQSSLYRDAPPLPIARVRLLYRSQLLSVLLPSTSMRHF